MEVARSEGYTHVSAFCSNGDVGMVGSCYVVAS